MHVGDQLSVAESDAVGQVVGEPDLAACECEAPRALPQVVVACEAVDGVQDVGDPARGVTSDDVLGAVAACPDEPLDL